MGNSQEWSVVGKQASLESNHKNEISCLKKENPIYMTFASGGRVGKEPSLAFEVFDFETQQWRKLPSVPSKRVFAMYTATDRHIFSIGGLIQPGNKGFSDACEVFDLEKGILSDNTIIPKHLANIC